ncbi:MAG: hypothetical protein HC875_39180 [Anaerolineales bacterium]|nr:hypothetical protein [Anaerolineales bacterium]
MKLPLSAYCHSLRPMLTIILALLLLAAGPSVWASPGEPQAAGMLVTWDEHCPAPPEGARVALDYAATIWGGLLTTPVPIAVRACWSSSVPAGALATGDATSYVRNFTGAPLADTYYPIALANALAGQDLLPGDQEISLKFKQDANWSL